MCLFCQVSRASSRLYARCSVSHFCYVPPLFFPRSTMSKVSCVPGLLCLSFVVFQVCCMAHLLEYPRSVLSKFYTPQSAISWVCCVSGVLWPRSVLCQVFVRGLLWFRSVFPLAPGPWSQASGALQPQEEKTIKNSACRLGGRGKRERQQTKPTPAVVKSSSLSSP